MKVKPFDKSVIKLISYSLAPCVSILRIRLLISLDTSDAINLEIFPINMGKDSLIKSKKFYKDLDIKNLDIFFDNTTTLAKDFNLRGIPTTILFNKNGKEFARILGSIDFEDIEFINWVKKYN